MNHYPQRLTTLLSGTSTNQRHRVWLHLGFWLVAFVWFYQQGHWLVGEQYPWLTVGVGLAKMAFAVVFFYTVSFCLGSRLSPGQKGLGLVLLLLGIFVAYGLFMYYLYTYISGQYPGIPPYVRKLAENIAKQGPFTFLLNGDVLYFHFQQLMLGLVLPLAIKGFRTVFKANYRTMALEKDNLKLELDFLRSQINPHFLFNTLNSVYALVEDKDQTAASVIYSLSNIMRFALYDSTSGEVAVEKELETIRNYLAIQEVRHSRRLSIDWDISPRLEHQLIPPLLLLTFVENAIKHGVDKYINQSSIAIRANHNADGAFCFEVVNSLPPQKAHVTQEGIGISNTRRRLDLLYPGRHALEIRQTENEYQTLLKIW